MEYHGISRTENIKSKKHIITSRPVGSHETYLNDHVTASQVPFPPDVFPICLSIGFVASRFLNFHPASLETEIGKLDMN